MDIDEQLLLLQQELMDVQEEKTNPLSERTVAEIMIKLQQQGFRFYPTTDGNEFITPAQLDKEIIDLVRERGRIRVNILNQLLNLSQDLIESRINAVCQASTHTRNNDSLLSRDYLANVINSIKHTLEVDGLVQLDELALAYEFNMAFLMKIVQENLHLLDAEVAHNQLITKQYRRMKKRRVLGFLIPVNRPLHIETFLKGIKIYDSSPETLIEELIAEGKLKGRCQNSFYIPDRFSKNQKQMIENFFDSNGFIDFKMLERNFQVAQPEAWVRKNLKPGFTIFEQMCFNKAKIEYYQAQILSLIKGEGFLELSTVLPFELDDTRMERFLADYCGISDFVLEEGVCYSEQWLSRCANQFRDKAIMQIFFKKNEQKGKKKGGKKDEAITEQQLLENIFDAGLADYSTIQNMSGSLLPLVNERFEKLKSECQKQLTQNQGVISNAFLKYKKCKTIIRSEENFQRVMNTIEKQKKKGTAWYDADFGPNENDPEGRFSVLYYDNIVPRQWQPVDAISWQQVPLATIINAPSRKHPKMQKLMANDLLEHISFHNQASATKIPTPDFLNYSSRVSVELSSPLAFKFFIAEAAHRYVLVDNRMPLLNGEGISCGGVHGLIEKAYAKLRYCYKGLLGVGIQQQILELTGKAALSIKCDKQALSSHVCRDVLGYIKRGCLVLCVGEGEPGQRLKVAGVETQMRCLQLYRVSIGETGEVFRLDPGAHSVEMEGLPALFKNVYVIDPSAP